MTKQDWKDYSVSAIFGVAALSTAAFVIGISGAIAFPVTNAVNDFAGSNLGMAAFTSIFVTGGVTAFLSAMAVCAKAENFLNVLRPVTLGTSAACTAVLVGTMAFDMMPSYVQMMKTKPCDNARIVQSDDGASVSVKLPKGCVLKP